MQLKRQIVVGIILFSSFFSVTSMASIKSYREWKTERVQMAQSKVATLRSQLDAKKASTKGAQGADPNLEYKTTIEAGTSQALAIDRLEKQLSAEQFDLDLANELSVTDYFVGYLTKVQDRRSAFKEVAGKLSPEEVAELMSAYASAVLGQQNLPEQTNKSQDENIQTK